MAGDPNPSCDDGIDYSKDYHPTFHDFYDLMKFKVSKILLVSSLYDAFTLEEDGLLSEQITGEYQDLALTSPPRVIRFSSGGEALKELKEEQYDLVITMARLVDMDPYDFGKRAKEIQPGIPVIMLLTDVGDLSMYHKSEKQGQIDKIFFWNGDSALFLAITKYVEDIENAGPDTEMGLVRVILVIEDSPRYYSMFLPLIYAEIMRQTSALIAEGLNEHEKLLRKRARPKILLAESFEEGMALYLRYRDHIMGIITDVSFPRGGKLEEEAGFQLIEVVDQDIPVLLQSSLNEHREKANGLGIPFLDKTSDSLLQDLRKFFKERLGFGGFVFSLPDGEEVGLAFDMKEFTEMVQRVPAESLRHHALHNDFSNWLMARGEIDLALTLRPKKVTDFATDEEMRKHLLNSLKESRRLKRLGVITDFSKQTFEFEEIFTRFGSGSLGGKGRGLAFLAFLIHQSNIQGRIPHCDVRVPDTVVIGTEVFDEFMDSNGLHEIASSDISDEKLSERFLNASLPKDTRVALTIYLSKIGYPIAVRSSSLLEDSQNQPFAGIYSTYILPNNCGEEAVRLEQLCQAIKLVYASTFYKSAKAYTQSSLHMAEEEKMAIVLQRLVGNKYGDRFYPVISGIAQSHNFYPVKPLERDDGIVSVALGLGKMVVEGERVLSFSPRYPNVIPGFATPDEVMKNSQQHFFALNMAQTCFDLSKGEDVTLLNIPVEEAEGDGTLNMIASTYDVNDNRLRDGLVSSGPKAITFSGVLKYEMVPLVSIITELLDIGEKGMGRPVEIEFAINFNEKKKPVFHILQIRPLVTRKERNMVNIEDEELGNALIHTDKALGNGILQEVRDIVFVPAETFDASKTVQIAREVGQINKELKDRPYILIGPGRWGTRDRWLGIPVEWDQISWARTIIEVALEDFRIDPSHGTHFFHNITSLGILYFTIPYGKKTAEVDWDWLNSLPAANQTQFVKHVRIDEDLVVKVDGRTGHGVVTKKSEK